MIQKNGILLLFLSLILDYFSKKYFIKVYIYNLNLKQIISF